MLIIYISIIITNTSKHNNISNVRKHVKLKYSIINIVIIDITLTLINF